MVSKWIRLGALPLIALTVAVAGCESTIGTERLTAPEVGASYSDGTTTEVKYKAVRGKTDTKARQDSKEISDKGGRLEVAGNVLIVPEGAVARPTLFVMKLAAQDSLGYTPVKVDLSAWERDADGKWKISVGEHGFLKPVELKLTYSWATDAFDPDALRIVWVKDELGNQQVYDTVLDPVSQTVTSWLAHFSDYILAIP